METLIVIGVIVVIVAVVATSKRGKNKDPKREIEDGAAFREDGPKDRLK